MTAITKTDGSRQQFNAAKLRRSLRRAGARGREIERIVAAVKAVIVEGMSTRDIYKTAFSLLRADKKTLAAAKYSLRHALFGLGPTGFPFEDFLARLFAAEGYTTKTRTTIKGTCIPHEIDVAAYRPAHSFVAEAKFHSRAGITSDVQVALSAYARFCDLRTRRVCAADTCGITSVMLITNTRFTATAMRYAACAGIELLSFDYPKKHSLQRRVEAAGLYPITALPSLSRAHKERLFAEGVVLCRELLARQHLLGVIGVPKQKRARIIKESNMLCASKKAVV